MKVEIISTSGNTIELAARVCYNSQKNLGKIPNFVERLAKSKHFSTFEHYSLSVLISDVSRSLTHQLVRHRHFSFAQQSQRFVLETQFDFVTPPSI